MADSPRRALVTGVGRRAGIAAAIADRLRADGWAVATTGWRDYDARMEWGADSEPLADHEVDLTDPDAPDALFRLLADGGPITAMVLCHAESVDSDIKNTTIESFDRHFAVNVRANWLLIRAFASQFPAGAAGSGRIVALTSDHTAFNLPYGASKGCARPNRHRGSHGARRPRHHRERRQSRSERHRLDGRAHRRRRAARQPPGADRHARGHGEPRELPPVG